jgi:hypothetical protein
MKFKPGPLVGQMSGSLGAFSASHNRYGPYMRSRVIPVNPDTEAQQLRRGYLTTASVLWKSLTEAERATWKSFASLNPITDALGASQTLSPNAACVQINARRLLCSLAALRVAPTVSAPSPLTVLTFTAEIGAGDCQYEFTPSPLSAGLYTFVRAALRTSTGISYIKNLFKFIGFGAAPATSPILCKTQLEDVYGTLADGQIITLSVAVFSTVTGLMSPPLLATDTVTTV